MRIISGFLKGKKIDFIKSTTTRPLRDFVKENIFNIINHSNIIDIKLINANILDIYSGVGSFGIECISRGARSTTFIENSRDALIKLKKNLKDLNIKKNFEILNEKTSSFFNKSDNKNKFELIFLDPPYAEDAIVDDLIAIKNSTIYKKKHLIIIHREIRSQDKLGEIINILLIKNYGRSKVIFGTF
mgnify:CR=1 FL=1